MFDLVDGIFASEKFLNSKFHFFITRGIIKRTLCDDKTPLHLNTLLVVCDDFCSPIYIIYCVIMTSFRQRIRKCALKNGHVNSLPTVSATLAKNMWLLGIFSDVQQRTRRCSFSFSNFVRSVEEEAHAL